jgi:hypothetical protein
MMAQASVTEDFVQSLDEWEGALTGASQSLLGAATHVESAGIAQYSSSWRSAVATAAATAAAAVAEATASATTKPTDPLTALVTRAAAIEHRSLLITNASLIILDPNVYAAASAKMSKTFSSERRLDIEKAKRDIAAAAAAARKALSLAAAAGALLAEHWRAAAELYKRGCAGTFHHGEVVTELFMGVLTCATTACAAATLQAAPDCALGIPMDCEEAATMDSKFLAEFHPLQRMGGSIPACFACLTNEASEVSEASIIDLSVGQALFDVAYDIAPLIDRKAAAKFGPVVNIQAGLNFNVVERLKTIQMAPRGNSASAKAGIDAGADAVTPANEAILVKVDQNSARVLSGAQPRAYFAGARPRAQKTADLLGGLIGIKIAEEAAWGQGHAAGSTIRSEYNEHVKRIRAADVPCNTDALLAALTAALEQKLPPAKDDSLGAGLALDFLRVATSDHAASADGYICQAVNAVNETQVQRRMQSALAQPAQRTPMGVLERELRLTYLLHSIDTAAVLYRRLRPEVESMPIAAIDWKKGAPHIKLAFMALFRRAAERALAASEINCAPMSLKAYALTLTI